MESLFEKIIDHNKRKIFNFENLQKLSTKFKLINLALKYAISGFTQIQIQLFSHKIYVKPY